ncbi:glutathione S-transferase [Oleiphilus messinensis]|uniref:Glutathione S-transferase n=1 Tax=Oleiphilus messinensis TaxID=141451 RepID=A0A1Y0ICN0_9GAMM|nr:glutathione S-transferase family protein [Oleiphilus messinensis]ARU58221.1 glutathione S-transferase [Oleiphilus messinensis]
MLTVYGHPNTRSTRITWMLEELGQDYDYKLVNFVKGGSKSAEFLAINPAGKVPVLVDGDLVLSESGAIVTYLGDKFPDRGLVPEVGSAARAHYQQWAFFALCELEQPLWTMAKHKFALPEAQRVPAVRETAVWEFQKALDLLDGHLADHTFIVGQDFSAADILVAHTLAWGMAFKQPITQKNVQRYFAAIGVRPALQAAMNREKQALAADQA